MIRFIRIFQQQLVLPGFGLAAEMVVAVVGCVVVAALPVVVLLAAVAPNAPVQDLRLAEAVDR